MDDIRREEVDEVPQDPPKSPIGDYNINYNQYDKNWWLPQSEGGWCLIVLLVIFAVGGALIYITSKSN